MDLKSQKKSIRREVIDRILAMDQNDRRNQEATLHRLFETMPGIAEAQTLLLYASAFSEEFDTRPILNRALSLGKRLVLPKVNRLSKSLGLFEVSSLERDLISGHKGIAEPSPDCGRVDPLEIDWVLVPGLAFDWRGFRLGRGAGHYDKLLPTLRPEVPRWALILDTQWLEDLPVEPHDQPLDGVKDYRKEIRATQRSSVAFGGAS